MSLFRRMATLTSKAKTAAPPRPRRKVPLGVEGLESRLTPALTYTFQTDALLPTDGASGGQNNPDVAAFADGGSVAVWESNGNIYGRRFDARKVGGNMFTVHDGIASIAGDPVVAANPLTKEYVVVWDERPDSGTAPLSDVQFRKFSAGGTSNGSGTVSNPNDGKNDNNPEVAMSNDSSFVVAYQHEFSASDTDVRFRYYLPNGSPTGLGASADGASGGNFEVAPAVAIERTPVGGALTFAVVWEDDDDVNGRDVVRLARYNVVNNAPTLVAGNVAVPESSAIGGAFIHETPSADYDDFGNLGVSWIEEDEAGTGADSLQYRVFEPSGLPGGSITWVSRQTGVLFGTPYLAIGSSAVAQYVISYMRSATGVSGFDLYYFARRGNATPQGGQYAGAGSNAAVGRVAMAGGAWVSAYQQRPDGGTFDQTDTRLQSWGLRDDRYGASVVGRVAQTGQIFAGSPALGQTAMTNASLGNWTTAATWVDVLSGRFDPNGGLNQVMGRVSETGEWWLTDTTGTRRWTTWAPSAGWKNVRAADVNRDGRPDILGQTSDSQWWAAVRLSNGTVENRLLASWSPAVNWQNAVVGDFNSDGADDFAAREPASGTWYVGVSTQISPSFPLTFQTTAWTTWSPAVTWGTFRVGDFDGDGRDDIAGRVVESGDWWVARSTGTAFTNVRFGNWSTGATWVNALVGDFNGDGRDDLIGRETSGGSWWALQGANPLAAVTAVRYTSWSTAANWVDVNVGDFNRDGRADVIGRETGGGTWWVNISTGSAATPTFWGSWSPSVTWIDTRVAFDF